MKNKQNVIKLMAIIGTGLGFAATLLSDWAAHKELENMIEDEVGKAFGNKKGEFDERSD